MIRKLALSTIAIVALSAMLFAFAPAQDAEAQVCTYNGAIVSESPCPGTLSYPVFSVQSTPVPTATPGPTSAAVVSADTIAATGGGTNAGAASIAFTGSESATLGYVGAGLIGFGAVALVVARRKSDTDLD